MSAGTYYNSDEQSQRQFNSNEYQHQQYHQSYQQSYSTYPSQPYQSSSDNLAASPSYGPNSYGPNSHGYNDAYGGSPQPAAYGYANAPQYNAYSQPAYPQHAQQVPSSYSNLVNNSDYLPASLNQDSQYSQPHSELPPSYGYQAQVHPQMHVERPPQYGYQQQGFPQPQRSPQPEADKGVMGALAGGALGAYGGHQVNHGVIGAVGGAIAGSKLEDHYKNDSKQKKKAKKDKSFFGWKRRGSNSSSSSSSSSSSDDEKVKPVAHHHHQDQQHQQPVLAGNFSSSCTSITVDRDYDLIASCSAVDGQQKLSSISLNSVLTNTEGQFRWAKGGNFGGSARNVRLLDNGKVLEAELGMGGDRGWNRTTIRLDERITNDNGELRFLE